MVRRSLICTLLSGAMSSLIILNSGLSTAFAVGKDADTSPGSTFDDGTLTYTILENHQVSVTSCITTATNISIMGKIDGYEIVSIGDTAFAGCEKLQSVTIPESISEIGEGAFQQCTSLKSVKLPNSLEVVPAGIFVSCTALESVTLGKNVTEIGDMAFGYCTTLKEINIPDTVTTIGDQVFCYATSLESIEIPDSVTSLGQLTFQYCSSLTEFEIPKTLEDLGYMTFLGCQNLKNITVEDGNPTYIEENNIIYNKDKSSLYLYLPSKGNASFEIPESVTTIGDAAFFGASNLNSVILNNNLEYIGTGAFDYCTLLSSISIPESVTFIGDNAFSDCSVLSNVTFQNEESDVNGKNLTIGSYAFYCCNKLLDVTVPKRTSQIGEYAFGCTESLNESQETEKKAVDGFLLSGYDNTAQDYVKNCDIKLSYKSLVFPIKEIAFIVAIAAVILVIAIISINLIKKNMMTKEEKEALSDAKNQRKVKLDNREYNSEDDSSNNNKDENNDDDYVSILDGAEDDADDGDLDINDIISNQMSNKTPTPHHFRMGHEESSQNDSDNKA